MGRDRRSGRRGARGPAVLLAAALLVGCTGPGLPGGGSPTGSGAGGDPGERPTAIDPGLRECGEATSDTETDGEGGAGTDEGTADHDPLQLTDADLTRATWSAPSGWQEASGFVEDRPVETLHDHWVAVPADGSLAGLDVATVTTYTGVDWGDSADRCGRVPWDAVGEQLAGYLEQIDARPLTEPEDTTVGGLPAVTQVVALSNYSYVGYWLFSQDQLLHVYCQWTDEQYRSVLEQACADIVGSVQVPDA